MGRMVLVLLLVLTAFCCLVGICSTGASQPELTLTDLRVPDEVTAGQGFFAEISYSSSLRASQVEKLIKNFDWQIERTPRKTGYKKKNVNESHVTVTDQIIRVRTSVGKPSTSASMKLKIEYGESEPFKVTNTVSSNPFMVNEKPDFAAFVGEWAGVWEWEKRGKHSRDARLTVEADSNKMLVTFTLGVGYRGSAKALLPREAIPEKTRTKHAKLKRKNGVVHISFPMGHREVELHPDNGQLVGGWTTPLHNTKCTLRKVGD